MQLIKFNKHGDDFEVKLFNSAIYHSYSHFDKDGAFEKCVCLFPKDELNKKYYKDIAQKYELSDDYYIFVTTNGLGDTFFVASFVEEFKKKYNAKVAILLRDEKFVELLSLFKDIDKIIVDKNWCFKSFTSDNTSQKVQSKKVMRVAFPYVSDEPPLFWAQHYAYLMGLDNTAKMSELQTPDDYLMMAEAEYRKMNLNPDKTIILSPYARYFDCTVLDNSFWEELANNLISQGYSVVFNTNKDEFQKFNCIFPKKILLLTAMIKKSAYFISFRAGINDVCAGLGIQNQICFYPDNLRLTNEPCFDKFKAYNDKLKRKNFDLFDYYSLVRHFGLPQNEFVLTGDNADAQNYVLNIVAKEDR